MSIPGIISSFLLFLWALSVSAGQHYSVKDGVWSDTSVWNDNQLPAFSDTIIVSHKIFFDADIEILPQGFLHIGNNGVLCGLYELKVSCGASFLNEGTLKAKNAEMDGSGENNGEIFISEFLQINSCGNIFSFGAMTVGVGYDCVVSIRDSVPPPSEIPLQISDTSSIATADSLSEKMGIMIFPNPLIDEFEVKYSLNEECGVSVSLYDSNGKLLAVFFDQQQKEGDFSHSFPIKYLHLGTGIYFVRISTGEKVVCQKVLKAE